MKSSFLPKNERNIALTFRAEIQKYFHSVCFRDYLTFTIIHVLRISNHILRPSHHPFLKELQQRTFFVMRYSEAVLDSGQNQYVHFNFQMTASQCYSCCAFQIHRYSSLVSFLVVWLFVSYLSINRFLLSKKKKNNGKERNYVANKSNVFFFLFLFVVRQKTGKLVTRDSSCTEIHFIHFLSGLTLKTVF